jgi:cell division protein FtsB
MAMSKFKMGLGVVVVAGAAAIIFLQYQAGQKLRAENEDLRQQIAKLKSDSQDTPTANSQPTGEDFNELLRLRGEVGTLRSQTNQIAKLQQQNQQLQDSLATAAQARQQSAAQSTAQAEEEHAHTILQINNSKQAVLGMMMYANDNQDQFPTNFDQAATYFGNSGFTTNLNQFEIVYRGSLSNLANPASTILVRSTQPWMVNGKWAKAYGFVDGHSEVHSDPNGNFDEWEQQQVPVLKN